MPDVSVPPPPLTADQRRALLAMRQWTPAERKIVARGLFGRMAIAVEPAIIALLFGFFTLGLLRLAYDGNADHQGLQLLAPIFALGALAFLIYAVFLMAKPVRALRETYQPIFVVDGYVRTRGRDDFSIRGFNGYVAVLLSDRRVACEWPTVGEGNLRSFEYAALCEFSEFGGIHAIDGQPTGVLPQSFSNIGVGTNRPPQESSGR
ncbi:MAG TPA: hypothetical protein VKR99_09655 [Candidatus Eremiobacteraceae bacterium]|nr:hypothetical protein [Candidatus Eremiobacteraceae bacterium]